MVSVTKYATVAGAGVWSNPSQALNAHNGLCADKIGTLGNYDHVLSTYGFAIPAGSTINQVFIGYHHVGVSGVYNPLNYDVQFRFTKGSSVWILSLTKDTDSGACADAVDAESEIDLGSIPLSVDDLNNENFTTLIRLTIAVFGIYEGWIDCVWIRVEYTPPVVAAAYGDGLTWVIALFKLKEVILRNLILTRQRLKLP